MTTDQYWSWFWLHMYYSLLFSIPVIVVAAAWAIIQWWYDNRDDKPDDTIIKFRPR